MANGWTPAEIEALKVAKRALFVGIIGVFFTAIGIATGLFPQEIRQFFGRKTDPLVVEVKCSANSSNCIDKITPAPTVKPKPVPTNNPTPAPLEESETAEEQSPRYATVDTRNDSGLGIRKNMDAAAEVIVIVPEDDQVEVLFCDNKTVVVNARLGSWCRVRYEDNEGWTFGPYIGIYPQTTAIDGSNDSNDEFRYVVKTRNGSGLNLRRTKDLSSDSVAFAEEGEEVEMIYCEEELINLNERDGRWCKIQYDRVQGWAWGWFLDKRPRKPEDSY